MNSCRIQRGKVNERTSARKRRVLALLKFVFYVIILTSIAPVMVKHPPVYFNTHIAFIYIELVASTLKKRLQNLIVNSIDPLVFCS